MPEKLHPESIRWARLATEAKIYSQVLEVLAQRRITSQQIARRIGRPHAAVLKKLASQRGWRLEDVSDFLLAVNCEAHPRIVSVDGSSEESKHG